MSGPRSQPPDLDGYSCVEWLGGGGFADVFLYHQDRPSRDVAVKVLRSSGLDLDERAAFDDEADRMAQVSSHPFIVTIFGADTARDGRPFLVMEYYGRSNYGALARKGGIAVADVLKLGVQVSSAVAVAHRAGILHRDIKPANILVNEYGKPGLTDFGISGARHEHGLDASQGYSIPYSAPEVLSEESPGDELSDVYALAATLYTILAGHSPFEVVGGDNSRKTLCQRVLNRPVPPLRRADVPSALEHLLVHAMDKAPAGRPRSALAFARSLQGVERELRLAVTPIDVPDERAPSPHKVADEDGTHVGRVQVVSPSAPPPRPPSSPEPSASPAVDAPAPSGPEDVRFTFPTGPARVATATPGGSSDTVHRPAAVVRPAATESDDAASVATATRRVPTGTLVGATLIVVVFGLLAGFALLRGGGKAESKTPVTEFQPGELLDLPAQPTNIRVQTVDGGIEVRWDAPGTKAGDQFRVGRVGAGNDAPPDVVDASPVVLDGAGPGCFQVEAIRGGQLSEPATGCTA